MIVKLALIKIGELDIHLTRKDIKNLHISVMPPDGQVRVSAPDAMTDTAIRWLSSPYTLDSASAGCLCQARASIYKGDGKRRDALSMGQALPARSD